MIDPEYKYSDIVSWYDPNAIVALNYTYDEEKYLHLYNSMRATGWKGNPIVVLAPNEDGYVFTLNGAHRVRVARDLGIFVPIYKVSNKCLEPQFLSEALISVDNTASMFLDEEILNG